MSNIKHLPRCEIVADINAHKYLVSLSRLSLGYVNSPRRQSGALPAVEYTPCGLNNAATSRILDNPAVITIFINFCKLFILFIFYYYKFNVEYFYNTTLSDKQKYSYLMCYFKFGLRTNHHLYPNLG